MTTNNASNYHRINHQSTSESISGVQVLQQANKQKSPTPSTHTEDAVRHSGKGTTAPKPSTADTREGRHAAWAAELIEKHQNAVANLRAAIAPFNPVGAPQPSPLEEKEAEKAHWLELAAAVDVLWLYDQNGTPALADYIKSQNDRKVTRFSDTIAQLELADVMVIEALYRHFHNLPFRYKEKPDYQKVVIPAETDEGKAAIEAHEGSRKYLSALYDLKEGQDLVEEGSVEYDLWWDALTQADKREQAAAARCLILSYEFQDAGLNNYVNRQIPSDHSDPTSTETIDIFSKLSTDTLTMLDRYFRGELIERPASEAA